MDAATGTNVGQTGRTLPEVRLTDVYAPRQEEYDEAVAVLYSMLARRPAVANISHKKMPAFAQHAAYVAGRPYRAWYLIRLADADDIVGQIYITARNEIGVQILPEFQKRGLATAAVRKVMAEGKGPFYANINPDNRKSIAFFRAMGFKIIQSTYALGVE